MEQEIPYNPTITEEETNGEILQNGVLEEVITVDQEFTEKLKVFQETISILQKNLERPTTENIGDPLEEYFKTIKVLSSWMKDMVNSTLSSSTFLPLNTTVVTDLDIINSSEEALSKIEIDIISHKQNEYNQLSSFSTTSSSSQIFSTFDSLWQNFNSLIELGKLKLQELKWVIELTSKVEQVEVEIKKVEAMLEGVEESRKKHLDDDDGGGNLISNSSPHGSNNSINFESSSDITVTGIVFSSSLLDEWYTKVVAVEELVQDVDAKVKEVTNILHHERFRSPKDLFDHFNHIINNNVPELRSKIVATKQALAHDRRIARWFDGANDADKSIRDTLNRVKQLEIPDFINKREWIDEEQNLASMVDDRKKIFEAIYTDALEFKSIRIDELDRKANDIIATIKDSNDADDQTVVELMTKQLSHLNERLAKLNEIIIILSSQTTTDRYSIVLRLLNSMEGMRNQMAQIRRTLIEHNDADLVAGDVKDVESQITEFESELLNDDSALAKALKQKHAKLLLTIQNIRAALAENKLQMAAYLSPSSPTSPTSAGSEFDRLRVTIQNNLETFNERLISPPTYMIDTDNENEEPERIHGLTCNDDHVAEITERYSKIESELTSFERTLWVEFWLKSDPAKRLRGEEVTKLIDDLEKKFAEVKSLMEDRKKDLTIIKEGREFAKGINAIRDQLDIVKGKMRRGDTTTDTSLQELDAHMVDAQELIKSLKTSYSHLLSSETEDKKYKEAFDEQLNQYNLVMGWIDEVRVWFREAVRIRGWVNERVEILLNVPKVDPFQEGGAPATQEQVDEWSKEHDELEREVEKFDSEDVTRLRAHVKGMVGGGDKQVVADEMSPADTMTIGITFETLKILDQLLGKLRNRENELALLALRVQWEREYGTAMNFWNRLMDEINEFVINRGRWKPPISPEGEDGWFVNEAQLSQHDVTSELQKINRNILDYIANTIPPTTEVFDDLFNTSQIEMPEHLIERQENIEERDKEYLEGYFKFANDVLTQRKQVIGYSKETESSYAEGAKLKDELIIEESNPRGGSIEKKFIARVIEFNHRIEKSWNSMAQKIHYPDHEKHDESENEVIRQAVVAYNERLKVLLAETDEALKNYQRALKFVELANEYKKEAGRLENWIAKKDDYINKRKFDVFQEPCKFTSQDIDNYVSGNSQIVVDIHNFDEEELKILHQKVAALISDVKTVGTKCVNTDELEIIMKNLDDKLKELRDDLQILQSREPDEVDAAKKRLIWEDSLKESNNFIDSATKESKEFVVSKASWKPKTPEDTSAHEVLNQEYSSLEGKVKDYISKEIVEHKANYDAFIDASEKLADKDRRNYIEARQSKLESNIEKLNEYNTFAHDLLEQRAAVVEYMSEATKVDLIADEIKKNLIEAEKNVSKGPSEIDFETQLKDFNQNVTTLWDERGSKLPYPTSPIMDEVKITKNAVIEEAAKKRLSSLESAGQELDKLYETYKTSLALQQRANECLKDSSRLQDWVAERLKKLEESKIDPLAEQCPWSEPEVQKMQEEHEDFLRENTKVDVEDISQVRRQFETLFEDIKKANCKSVDQKQLREALESLNKSFGELQSISSSRQLDLSVLQSRAKWEDQYGPCSNSIDELTNQVNEFISTKARWSPEKANPETDIHQEFTDLKQKVSEFEEKPLASTKLAYNDMISSINTYLSKQPPKHISDRQLDFLNCFDHLTERLDLSKQVLDQRDAINTYLNQANFVEKEGESLKEQLKSAEENGEVDPSFTDKLATFKDYLDSLKSDFADKIAYPKDSISIDDVNAPIKQVVDTRMGDLTNLSKELDELFKSYQDTMKLSEELEDALSNYKQLVDELDNFIFDKASWQTQDPTDKNAVDSVIKDLLAELDDLNKKIADFDKNTVKPVNDKVDDYEKVMTAKEKGVPEHIEKRHKKLDEFLNELDVLDKYARDVIDQRKAIMDYMTDGARLKKEAEQIQQILLSNEPSSPGGEGNTVSNAVNSFADRVRDLCNVAASQIEYPTCSIQNVEKDRIGRTEDSNNLIKEAVNAQNESLKSLANSLKELLETHQNVLRRKKMIESYINQADDVASWIQPKLDTLKGILDNETLGELSKDKIHDLIGEVDGIEAARQAYHSAFNFAKSLANKLIEEMIDEIEQGGDDTEDVKADLELVQAKQKEIDTLWAELQSDVPKAKDRLDQALQVVDFKEKANEVLNKVSDISNIMSSTPVEDVTNADIKDWQIKLNNLEQAELFSLIKHHDLVQENLKENYGALSDKESRELEDLLRKVANAIGALKKLMNNKIDETEAYQSSQIANAYMNRVSHLQRWIDDSIATFADSKPKHGIMVGNSDELNKNNFNELTSVYETFIKELPDRVDQLENIRTEFNEISLKEGIRELQDILKCQSNLDQSWDKLDLATGEFKNFIRKTTDWHYRHGSIYHVENDIFEGLEERINGLGSIGYDNLEAEVKELDEKIKKAKSMLEDAKLKASHIVDDPDDLIDLTNRENFNNHYNEATNRLNELSTSFQVALTAAHNASLLAAFHADANRMISNCYEGTAIVKSRHEDLENSGYYALEVDALGVIIRDAIDGYSESEEKLDKYSHQINVDLKKEADKLIELNPEANKNRILNIFSKVTAALEQFSDTVALERREIELSRRVHSHAKTAHDIKNWIGSCKMAVLNIQAGSTLDQEEEIIDLEEKVANFQSFIDKFRDSSHRVLIPEDDSAEIDAPQPEEINPKIKDSIQTRTNRVLEDWYGLKDLLAHLRTSLNASKEAQEVSRSIKDIFVAIGQVKERVLNIESFITGEGVPRLPTKDDVEGGERELDEIQAEVDHILGPRIEALDEMINNLTENDSGYVQQRHGIAEALTNLASIIDTKRTQLREAHNLALFGTKADEMNALMSSLLEVVDLATTTMDGSPLSSLPINELQLRSIELETKYDYYRPKIQQKFEECKRLAEPLKEDWRVEDRLGILKEQWAELIDVANAKKDELKRLLTGQKPKTRHGRSNSQIMSVRRRGVVSPGVSPSRNPMYRPSTRTASATPTRLTPSPTPGSPGSPRRPPIRLLPHNVNNYIPDPKDQLDVEVARIVNACPVKIKVSMVDGEPGKYMFGEVDPKLCYCRILRSRMVMVRVGGGWAELSKFLVEHANLEQKYIPKARSFVGSDETESTAGRNEASSSSSIYEKNLPKGYDYRIEGSADNTSLALKQMRYVKKNQQKICIWAIGLAIFIYYLIALAERNNTWDECRMRNKPFLAAT